MEMGNVSKRQQPNQRIENSQRFHLQFLLINWKSHLFFQNIWHFYWIFFGGIKSDWNYIPLSVKKIDQTSLKASFYWISYIIIFQIFYRYIAAKKLRNLKVYEITQALPPRKGDNLFIRAKFVMDTVNTFISSADPCITTEHVPEKRMDDNGQMTYIDSDKKNVSVYFDF